MLTTKTVLSGTPGNTNTNNTWTGTNTFTGTVELGPLTYAATANSVLRIGTNAIITSAQEGFSFLRSMSSDTVATMANFTGSVDFNGAITNSQTMLIVRQVRTITTSQTDTSFFQTLSLTNSFSVPAAQTYTNNSTTGIASLLLNAPSTISGSYAITRYSKIRFAADTIATGTRKVAIAFGTLTGATNNCQISDNTSFSGNFFINSTDTNPSVLGGQLRVASLGVANSAAASVGVGVIAAKIEVFDASGVSLGFVPVYATIT